MSFVKGKSKKSSFISKSDKNGVTSFCSIVKLLKWFKGIITSCTITKRNKYIYEKKHQEVKL